MLTWLQIHFGWYIFLVGLISLIISSFLNVCIYRLPIMLKKKWHKQCHDFLQMQDSSTTEEHINLAKPYSYCPHCKARLKFYHNIPIISYIFLKGRCAYCQELISWQYPTVELLTTALALIIAFQLGASIQALALIVLMFALIVLTFIDLKHLLLPDNIVESFLWLGLILNIFNIFTTLTAAVLGAVFGYLSLWIVNKIFKAIRNKDGMGDGDFKLFALLGAWFGWPMLPIILIIAAGLGAITGIIMLANKSMQRETPMPFGPFLAIGGLIVGIWGTALLQIRRFRSCNLLPHCLTN